ncbi:rhomboid family intramembrane serine protease [Bacteriovoracaceae bacterium]|nr:rhomboid family intramembrane serine protease [Bacteriovoracaceae bacterium]
MFKFGELKDKKIAQKIKNDLVKKSIIIEVKYNYETDLHELYATKEEDLEEAFNYFRVVLGFPPVHQVDPEWDKLSKISLGNITKLFIIISVSLYILIHFLKMYGLLDLLFISNSRENLNLITKDLQIWRLVTPAFLHFSIIHILFNLLWLKTLGSVVEQTKGWRFYLIMFLISAILSNILQFYVTGFKFGGMSGFVYSLFGYLWLHKKFHSHYEFGLPKRDIYLMVGWFFLCFTGLIGNIANTAHGVGLGLGMLFAIFPLERGQILKYLPWVIFALILSVGTFLIEYFQLLS